MTDDKQSTFELLADLVAGQQAAERIYSDDFRLWYAAYPRKRAPGDAWRAWQAIRARPPLPVMLAPLAWQRQTDQWTQDGGRFIPYPASYLRARSWEDDPPARALWCPFHKTTRNNGYPAPRPVDVCPECKHVAASRARRVSEPTVTQEVAQALELREPRWTAAGEEMLQRDFAEAFPGEPWPGKSEAWKRMMEKGRKDLPRESPPPAPKKESA